MKAVNVPNDSKPDDKPDSLPPIHTPEYWLQVADREREASRLAGRRQQAAYALSGSATGGIAAERALEEAHAIAERLRAENAVINLFGLGLAPAATSRPLRLEQRIVPGDYVAIRADALIGMEAELARATSRMHAAQARLAEYQASGWMRRTEVG